MPDKDAYIVLLSENRRKGRECDYGAAESNMPSFMAPPLMPPVPNAHRGRNGQGAGWLWGAGAPPAQEDAGSMTAPCTPNFGDPKSSLLACQGRKEEWVGPAALGRGSPGDTGRQWVSWVAVGRLPGGGGEAACQSQLPPAAYARPNDPLKSSKQLISTTWNVFVANL